MKLIRYQNRTVESSGHLVEPLGRSVESSGHLVEPLGRSIESSDHLVEPLGRSVESSGHVIEPLGLVWSGQAVRSNFWLDVGLVAIRCRTVTLTVSMSEHFAKSANRGILFVKSAVWIKILRDRNYYTHLLVPDSCSIIHVKFITFIGTL